MAAHQITRYTAWLARERGLRFDASTPAGYDALQAAIVSVTKGGKYSIEK